MIHFLSGLPRSGSTLLASILAQNPAIHATSTSGLIDMLGAMATAWEGSPNTRAAGAERDEKHRVLAAMVGAKYAPHAGKVVIDKSRGWPTPVVMDTMEKVLGAKPRIIATVRPIAECVASFVRLIDPDDVVEFCKSHYVMQHMRDSYDALKAGYAAAPENFLFVEYDGMMEDPARQLRRVYEFLGLPHFAHSFDNIVNPSPERDEEVWGIPGLHSIRPALRKTALPPLEVLGPKLCQFYQKGQFWSGPEPEDVPEVLDVALEHSLKGRFDQAEELLRQLAELDPMDERVQFNLGWYDLRAGRLREGSRLLLKNRIANPVPVSAQPRWEGQDLGGKTLILQLDGGLGDQIFAVRFARYMKERTGVERLIISASPELAPLLHRLEGVDAYAQVPAAGGIYHDYWITQGSYSMCIPAMLGLEYADISGAPYIPCASKKVGEELRVGLRWLGNPKFEHEQHRVFDPTPLWSLKGVELVSLQRDAYSPMHLFHPWLRTWEETKAAIETCDLVISSCTSVAHLAAAMGKPTWIIVPILPYILWAQPGPTAPWYDSVRLFRQTVHGSWDAPLNEVTEALEVFKREHKDQHRVGAEQASGVLELGHRSEVKPRFRYRAGQGPAAVSGQQRVGGTGIPHIGAHRGGVLLPDARAVQGV